MQRVVLFRLRDASATSAIDQQRKPMASDTKIAFLWRVMQAIYILRLTLECP